MNILLLVPRMNIGGAESHVTMLARLLHKAGHQVIVASGGGALANELAKEGIKQIYLPVRLSTSLAAFFLRFIIKKYHIELIHAHSAAAGIAAVKYKLKCAPHFPVIYTAHGLFGNEKEKLLLQCDKIIAVSRYVRQVALENGAKPQKVQIIYNGIDSEKFAPVDKITSTILRHTLHIPKTAFCLAITARIKNMRNKGHAHLLDILATHVGAAHWHLLIIGTGKGKWQLMQRIKKLKLNKRVHLLGHKSDIEHYLPAADVIVLPSYFETFGLVLAEGMAMGKPAVTYAVGGTPEIIDDGKTGYLIKYGDKEAFYQKLHYLALHPDTITSMGEAARLEIKERFSEHVMFSKILQVYKDCSQTK